MKFKLTLTFLLGLSLALKAQVTVIAGDHRVVNIGDNTNGDYARSVILLHEIYNGAPVAHNFAVGTITAMRGNQVAYARLNSVTVNTLSAYSNVIGSLTSYDDYSGIWN
jgi:hypothetical protein